MLEFAADADVSDRPATAADRQPKPQELTADAKSSALDESILSPPAAALTLGIVRCTRS